MKKLLRFLGLRINHILGWFGIKLVKYRSIELRKKVKLATEALRLMSEILTHHNCIWWVSHGTLLGFIRDGKFISHDKDIDISIFFNENFRPAFYEIRKSFNLVSVYGFKENSLELTFERDSIRIDLFFVYNDQENLRHSAFANFTRWDYIRYDYLFSPIELVKCKFLGLNLNCPKDSQKYLLDFYGRNWRLPNRRWTYYLDPPNVFQTRLKYCRPICEAHFFNWVDAAEIQATL